MTDIIIPDWNKHETGIYFILAEEVARVKIGKSVNITQRMSTMKTNSPVLLELVAYFLAPDSAERFIHSVFSRYRLHGEWFTYSKQIQRVVKKLSTESDVCFMHCIAEDEASEFIISRNMFNSKVHIGQ